VVPPRWSINMLWVISLMTTSCYTVLLSVVKRNLAGRF